MLHAQCHMKEIQEILRWVATSLCYRSFEPEYDFKGPGKRGHIVADTLLQTQMFPRLPARATLLQTQILRPQQMFPILRSPRNIMDNNVSATMCPRLPGPLGVI